jgi:mannitol operon transcriptional antiterminator
VLAAIDGDSHLKALGQLVNILNNANIKEKLLAAKSSDEIYKLLESNTR